MIIKDNKELANKVINGKEVQNIKYIDGSGDEHEIWTNSLGSLVDLGIGQSFNVSNLPNYQSLTADNFFVYYIEGTNGGGGSTSQAMANDGTSKSNLYKSYNQSTGVLTCYNEMKADWRASDQTKYSNKNTNVRVKVFIPNTKVEGNSKVIKYIDLGVGQSFDVSEVFSGYRKLTTNDFYISTYEQISYHEHTGTSGSVSVYLTLGLVKSYDANTGILTYYCNSSYPNKPATSNVHAFLLKNKY